MSIAKSKVNHTARMTARGERIVAPPPMSRLIPVELAVRRIAESEGGGRGFDSKNFHMQISESRTAYSVLFVPNARVRGGGLRIGIGKRDLKVKQVVYLQ